MRPIEKRLDKLASELCRLLSGGRCYMSGYENCDEHDGCEAHHIEIRDHRRQRWNQYNLVWLCRGHHLLAAKETMGFDRDISVRVKHWSLPELQDLEKEITLKIKEAR